LLGLCLDTGHATYGGGNALELPEQHRARIDHVHFKDCDPRVAAAARQHQWDYIQAVRSGLFCELGDGCVDFAAIAAALQRTGYDGWIVVEQDVLPSVGSPAASAARNRAFLRRLAI
jgi:inosose dehydratase